MSLLYMRMHLCETKSRCRCSRSSLGASGDTAGRSEACRCAWEGRLSVTPFCCPQGGSTRRARAETRRVRGCYTVGGWAARERDDDTLLPVDIPGPLSPRRFEHGDLAVDIESGTGEALGFRTCRNQSRSDFRRRKPWIYSARPGQSHALTRLMLRLTPVRGKPNRRKVPRLREKPPSGQLL